MPASLARFSGSGLDRGRPPAHPAGSVRHQVRPLPLQGISDS